MVTLGQGDLQIINTMRIHTRTIFMLIFLVFLGPNLSISLAVEIESKSIQDKANSLSEDNDVTFVKEILSDNSLIVPDAYNAVIEALNGDLSNAIQHLSKSLLELSTDEQLEFFDQVNLLGHRYLLKSQNSKALTIFRLSYEVQSQLSIGADRHTLYLTKWISEIYLVMNKLEEAEKYNNVAVNKIDMFSDMQDKLEVRLSQADLSLKKGAYDLAKDQYLSLLSNDQLNEVNREDALAGLSEAYFGLGKHSEAINSLQIIIQDKEARLNKYKKLRILKLDLAYYYAKLVQIYHDTQDSERTKLYSEKCSQILSDLSSSHSKHYEEELTRIRDILDALK